MSKKLTQTDIAEIIKDIDICMMTTQMADGALISRPMSNNHDVTFKGDCYFFTEGDADVVQQIAMKPEVNLAFIGRHSLLNTKKIYLSLSGSAITTQDKAALKRHWVPDLEAWFENGLETPGLTLIQVHADSVQYWDGREEGTVTYNAKRKAA